MENSKINLLRSELNMAATYIDRLFHGILDLSDLDYHPQLKKLIEPFESRLFEVLTEKIYHHKVLLVGEQGKAPNLFREHIATVFECLEQLTRLGVNDQFIEPFIEIINVSYELGRELHLFVLRETDLAIELPRTLAAKEITKKTSQEKLGEQSMSLSEFLNPIDESDDDFEFDDWNEETLPLFKVSLIDIEESSRGGSILSFSIGTLKKAKELINKGHECVFEKKYTNALVFFEKARRLHETSEVLTLIGWVYSLLNNTERAKNFCLKAIEIDPDYGPAYNDIGSYLLQEGDTNEAIRWFKLAKEAPIYSNKEYPFINMGRALLMQKKYRQALDEFHEAKKLAPHQRQINDTINKIERLMESNDREVSKVKTDGNNGIFPFHQTLTQNPELGPELQ